MQFCTRHVCMYVCTCIQSQTKTSALCLISRYIQSPLDACAGTLDLLALGSCYPGPLVSACLRNQPETKNQEPDDNQTSNTPKRHQERNEIYGKKIAQRSERQNGKKKEDAEKPGESMPTYPKPKPSHMQQKEKKRTRKPLTMQR